MALNFPLTEGPGWPTPPFGVVPPPPPLPNLSLALDNARALYGGLDELLKALYCRAEVLGLPPTVTPPSPSDSSEGRKYPPGIIPELIETQSRTFRLLDEINSQLARLSSILS